MKKIFYLLFTFNFLLLTSYAQDYHKIDSLKTILKTLPALNGTEADTLRMKITINIGNLFKDSKPDSAIWWYTSIADTIFNTEKIKNYPKWANINSKANN